MLCFTKTASCFFKNAVILSSLFYAIFLIIIIFLQLVKEFDVIHTPNQSSASAPDVDDPEAFPALS